MRKLAGNGRSLALLTCLAIGWLGGATLRADDESPHDAAARPLFLPADDLNDPGALDQVALVRCRPARIDHDVLMSLISGRRDHVELNLFDDARFIGIVDRYAAPSADALSLSGSFASGQPGGFTLVVRDTIVAASIRDAAGRNFEVRYRGGEAHWISEVDPARFAPCGTTVDLVPDPVEQPEDDGPRGPGSCGGIARIDMMVVYTPAARDAAGGVAAIESIIDLYAADTNTAFQTSGVDAEVRIVHKALVNYDESTGSWSDHLRRVSYRNDGIMDEVHAWRNEFGADAVSLFVNAGGACGIGWLMQQLNFGWEQWMFSVVQWGCSNFTFAHELGHNIGCHHDRQNAGRGLFDYSYGYRFNGQSGQLWRTVLAYAPGSRIARFSSPDVLYDGRPTGVQQGQPDAADNVSTINSTVPVVAQFRRDPDDCNGNCTPDALDISSGTSPDANGNGVPDECESPILYVNASAGGGNNGTAWADAYNDLQDALIIAANSSNAVNEIWVAAGQYKPDRATGDRFDTFLLARGIPLYGGFVGDETSRDQRNPDPTTNGTILSGDIGTPGEAGDNSYHVVTLRNAGNATRIEGFTITAGNADAPAFPHSDGAGLFVHKGAPIIANCVVTGNQAALDGGGIRAFGDIDLVNSLVVANVARRNGGGVFVRFPTTITNTTISSNVAVSYGGGVAGQGRDNSPVTIGNAILWNNTAGLGGDQLALLSGPSGEPADITVRYSAVQGGEPGVFVESGSLFRWTVGNTAADPRFRDLGGGDYHLLGDSSCIDAADNFQVPAYVNIDLNGRPRFVDDPVTPNTGNGTPPIVDMGAYEFQLACRADLTGDGVVDLADLGILLADFGCTGGACVGDVDGDGDTDLADLGILLAEFGNVCP